MSHSQNAHAALIEDGIVREVIVIPYCDDDDATITAYCNGIGLEGTWVDTSYVGARRGRFAGVGMKYDPTLNEFIAPAQPEPEPPAP